MTYHPPNNSLFWNFEEKKSVCNGSSKKKMLTESNSNKYVYFIRFAYKLQIKIQTKKHKNFILIDEKSL